MNSIGFYAVMCVSDMERATAWYEKLLGRAPDARPMDWLVQWWREGGGVQVWRDTERAGHSLTTIIVTDMATERKRLAAAGLTLGEDTQGDWGIIAQISDPDGNRITLAEPPRR
jgi:predicted enzyme related to lactoylglutathione lyase